MFARSVAKYVVVSSRSRSSDLPRSVLLKNASIGVVTPVARNMATLREIEMRLKSIKNIEKITKTMKTVASSKLPKASRNMAQAKVYGETSDELFKNAETKQGEGKTLFIVASSDKGLCGGVHSQLSKATRRAMANSPDSDIVILGDKCKAQLQRQVPEHIVMSFNQIGKEVPTFQDAQAIADLIIKTGKEYEKIEVIYNKYVSGISYEPETIHAFSQEAFKNSPNFAAYEIEDDVLANLAEFTFANSIYWALAEGHACELSARRNAMDNASKNAADMIERFTIQYNRTRQAVITTGLVDIVTGKYQRITEARLKADYVKVPWRWSKSTKYIPDAPVHQDRSKFK